jgi:hypothetical protein
MGGRPARELVRDRRAAPICATSLAGVTREVEEKWTSVPQIKMGYPIVQVSIACVYKAQTLYVAKFRATKRNTTEPSPAFACAQRRPKHHAAPAVSGAGNFGNAKWRSGHRRALRE